MAEKLTVLSVGTPILGNAVYHANMAECLAQSSKVRLIARSTSDYWGSLAKILFATVASGRIHPSSYRHRAEWVFSEVVRRGLKRELPSIRPDVIHCHTQAHALGLVRLAKSTPLVVSMDATARLLGRLPQYAPQTKALARIARLEQKLFRESAVVGGVSNWVTNSIRQDYGIPPDRIRLCSPAVDTEFFRPSPAPRPRNGSRIRVVFVGNDLERKGGLDLLDLIRGPLAGKCELRMVTGAPPPKDLPRDVVWRHGLLPRTPELLAELQQADVFALPTKEDCFPQALVEALACGLPLIGTRIMGVPELVMNGINGFTAAPGDISGLLDGILRLQADASLRSSMGDASREQAIARFGFHVAQCGWEETFTAAMESGPGGGYSHEARNPALTA